MKRIIGMVLPALMMGVLLAGCGSTEVTTTPPPAGSDTPTAATQLKGTVKTGGSTSVEKVMLALIYQFQEDNKDVKINYEANGSGDGITNTKSGLYEIGHSSRELKTDGTEDGLTMIAYAIDGIAIVVNPANGITNLTKAQVKDIYTGKIKNWNQLGGADALITVVTREASSGTRSAFAEIIGLEKKVDGVLDESTKIVDGATEANGTGPVQTTVAQNPNAIGYLSFSDVDPSLVKTIQFESVEISTDTLKDSSYTLKREFYMLTKDGTTLSPEAQAFIDFVMSDAGQAIVAENKLLQVK